MSNLALGLLPLEKDNWIRPEVATNGIITGYDAHNGFAYATWPCKYTLELPSITKISNVSFLLWDGLGKDGNKRNNRKYRFSLNISSDGLNYHTVLSTENQAGFNGWIDIELEGGINAKRVQLVCHFHSDNKEFHIVEFEIHDSTDIPFRSNNTHHFHVKHNLSLPNEEEISVLIDNVITKKSKVFEGIEEKVNLINSARKEFEQNLNQIELIKKSIDFEREASNNENRSFKWLVTSISLLVVFIIILVYFLICDNRSTHIISDSALNEDIKPYTTYLLTAYYVGKATLLSLILFILGWCLKNYRSEKHNYVINKHKAMSLTVATGILTKDEFKNTDRGNIFIQAMEIIFSHQSTGFTKEESGNSPSIVNTLLQKDFPKKAD